MDARARFRAGAGHVALRYPRSGTTIGSMDSRELERLNRRYLLPRLPGFAAKGALVIATPVSDLLRALHFEPSGFARDTRRVRYFVMPLYEPNITYLHFTFARVLGGAEDGRGDRWFDFPADREPVMREIADLAERVAVAWLARIQTPADFVAHAGEFHTDRRSPVVRRAVGFSQVLAGDLTAARIELDHVRREIIDGDDRRDWVLEMADSASEVVSEIVSDPRLAVARLRAWRDEAVRALGLVRFADPPPGPAAIS
jgi:hypothetical protein